MEFVKLLDGVSAYLEAEIFPNMADWQQMIARIALGRAYENKDEIVEKLGGNGIIRTFRLMDESGNVDVDRLMKDIRNEVSRAGKIEIKIPMFGKMTFSPEDVDILHKKIIGGVNENNQTLVGKND